MATPQPGLSATEQESLEQLVTMTNQTQADALALLRRSDWSVPVAIAKFFDGKPDDIPLEPIPTRRAPQVQNLLLDDQLDEDDAAAAAATAATVRTEPARRIVPPLPLPVWRPSSLLVAVLLAPLHVSYRVLVGLWNAVQYVAALVPAVRRRGLAGAAPVGGSSGGGGGGGGGGGTMRRALSPRDAATRFRREFAEQYGSSGADALPFAEEGYAQAYDRAKAEPRYLLVVLLSPEHDDTDRFVRETLLAPAVTALLANPANHFLVWGGSVRDPEAFQVAAEFQATRFPFSALVCVTPREAAAHGSTTRMGTIKRLAGPVPAALYAAHLRGAMRRYADDLAAVRADRVERESSRALRQQQDDAYERSLAADRARAAQRRAAEQEAAEQERLARARAEAAARTAVLARQWRRWRQAQLAPEPAAGTPGVVRVAIKLPLACGGTRVRRAFDAAATVEDLYAFVDGEMEKEMEKDEDEEGDEEKENNDKEDKSSPSSSSPSKPSNYTYLYPFRIASMLPREVHEPSEEQTLLSAIGKSASLVVEPVDEDE